jgi:hypothetical protein
VCLLMLWATNNSTFLACLEMPYILERFNLDGIMVIIGMQVVTWGYYV